jgi:polyisoprenoid-binding protein YceI
MTVHFNTPLVYSGICAKRTNLAGLRVLVAALLAATMGLHGVLSQAAAEKSAPPATAPVGTPPAGAYKLDNSHASLILRASHLGFSTYTTRFSRFDAELKLDPRNLSAASVVTTIDASSFEMDAAPQMCIDIMKGPQMLDTAKFPQIVFKSEKIRMTGAKSMEISGTLTLHGVTRPTVLVGTYNGGYAGWPGLDPQARVGFSAHGAFKRSDFGIAYGVPAPGTTIGVGDSIDFSIEAEFTGPPLAGAGAQAH